MAPSRVLIAAAVLVTAPLALAACPNACSGHGTCGEYDSCACHTNWEGGDCSLRTCPYQFSWITTNKGDVNFDGSTYGSTIYDANNAITSSGFAHISSQQNPGGDWEKWPATFNTLSTDEGHFYMECSNRGVCDRSTGICKCFDGYTGDACRRAACPESCNGHGTCQAVSEQLGSYSYELWDGDKSRNCVCDAGYAGPSCADRVCPRGDDPLTVGQHNEIQWVDIYSDIVSQHDLAAFSGTIKLTFTDHDGRSWVTDPVTVAPYANVATTMDDNIKTALLNLPNSPITDVTVTEGYCETPIPGAVDSATSVLTGSATHGMTYDLPNGAIVRIPADADPTLKGIIDSATDTAEQPDGTTVIGFADGTSLSARLVAHYNCVRFKIEFTTVTGDLPLLQVDTSGLTLDRISSGGSIGQASAGTIGSSVVDTLPLGVNLVAGGVTADFVHPSTVTVSCTTSCATSGTTITLENADAEDNFRQHDVVSITCAGVNFGKFTITAVGSATSLTTSETMPTCSAGSAFVITLESYYIGIDADLVGILDVGAQLNIDTFKSMPYSVSAVYYDASTHVDAGKAGRIFLDRAYVGDNTNSETATTATTDVVEWYGKGTTESAECSDRGVCNPESGVCKCFKGYTGAECSTQNALARN